MVHTEHAELYGAELLAAAVQNHWADLHSDFERGAAGEVCTKLEYLDVPRQSWWNELVYAPDKVAWGRRFVL